jgi:uncharacterized protein (TIGR02302 family)
MKRLITRAWAALVFERIWRGLVFPLSVIGFFLCVSWAGLWLEVPHTARIVLVLLFAGLLGFSLVRLIRTSIPSRRDALARIDQVSGFAHRPASALDDTLANAGQDPVTQALWALHKRRAAKFIGHLRAGAPSPGVTSIDRYALRGGVLVALIACAFLAGPEKYARIAAAFDWRGTGVSGNSYRLDAWIDPPPYTGKAPQLLNLGAPEAKQSDHPMAIEAPVNSTVIVRSSGGETAIDTHGALAEPKSAAAGASAKQPARVAGETEHKLLLTGDADLTLHHAGGLLGNFEIHVIADRPPTVALTEVPKGNMRGSLTLDYRLSDDYGVTGAGADFSAPKTPDGDLYAGRSLAAPPHADLSLAPGAGGLGDATTTADLSDHPWAGLRVTMTLTAKDDGGNEGKSDPVEITLPRKPFSNPLARALAEQRRDLLLQPDDRAQVGTALSALMIAPEAFGTKDSVYLGLRIASDRLNAAKTDADLVSLADYLWNMALQIENGDLSDAERDMRAAEQKLREALQRNAPPEEIRKLTEELRAAMDKFVKELAEKDPNQGNERDNADRGQNSQNQNRSVTPKQLQSMLDQMQELAKSGNMADAQKALDQLQNILENLKSANKRNSDPRARETRRALNDLDRMSKEQQDLRDETYKQSQDQQSGQQSSRNGQKRSQRPQQNQSGSQDDEDAEMDQDQKGQPGQQGQDQESQDQQSSEQLQQRQQALRNRLDQLQKRLKQMGQNEQGLDDAENAMKDAEKGLGEGGEDGQQDAVDAQGRALDSMRKGAQKLAEKLQKGQGQGQPGDGDGEGEDGSSQQSEDSGDADPLGRPRSNSNHNPGANTPFNPMGTPAVQRAQRVLEELRRRLSDPTRPQEETDYLERLLRRY